MNNRRTYGRHLLVFLVVVVIGGWLAAVSFAQERTCDKTGSPEIACERLKDGVEHWQRQSPPDQRSWFFRQMENLFDVVLGNDAKLPFGKSVALLVGVSQYKYIEPNLPFVKNDLADMRTFLLAKGGFDEVYVASEGMVNRDLIEEYMRNKFPQSLRQEDRLLFYYAGHGADNRGKTGYMQFADAESGNFVGPQVLAISVTQDWNAPTLTQILDTLSKNGSRIVITAGTANEKTFEVQQNGRGNGVFTRAFLNAVESGQADLQSGNLGKDGLITIDEVMAQIKNELARFGQRVTPRQWDLDPNTYRGTFLFLNPAARQQKIAFPETYAQEIGAEVTDRRGAIVGVVGLIEMTSYLTGDVYIDDKSFGQIESGETRRYEDQPVGRHRVAIRAGNQTLGEQAVEVAKGRTSQVRFEAETIAAPEPTATPVPVVVKKTPTPLPEPTAMPAPVVRATSTPKPTAAKRFRSEPLTVSDNDFYRVFGLDENWRPLEYIQNNFEDQGNVVIDHATGLTWQKAGSDQELTYQDAQTYIARLNRERFGGYADWRLPTIPELMSLIEREQHSNGMSINPIFDQRRKEYWSSDKSPSGSAWLVNFSPGLVYWDRAFKYKHYVRAVRS
jgi:hypothetical protein